MEYGNYHDDHTPLSASEWFIAFAVVAWVLFVIVLTGWAVAGVIG